MDTTSLISTTKATIFIAYTFRPIQFGVLLFASICSMICYIFVFYEIFTNRTASLQLSNHMLILLLISNAVQVVTDIPLRLSYYYMGRMWPFTVSYCYFYYFIDVYLFTTSLFILTWSSFERHILIFHSQKFNIFRSRLMFHYIPLSFCVVYPFIYYIIFIFFYPCENYFNTETSYCISLCFAWTSSIMTFYELVVHGFALFFILTCVNFTLFLRVILQKKRMKQQMKWTKNLTLSVQLFSICFLYLVTTGPYYVLQLVQILWDPSFGQNIRVWVFTLPFFMPLLIPFIYISTVPSAKKKLPSSFDVAAMKPWYLTYQDLEISKVTEFYFGISFYIKIQQPLYGECCHFLFFTIIQRSLS